MAPFDAPRPMLAETDDRRPDQGSRYVAESAELADIQSRIRHDLRLVGRFKDHAPEAIVAASHVVRSHPSAWPQFSDTSGNPAAQALQLVLAAWREAQAEAKDVGRWIARVRMQAAEQLRLAESHDALAAQRERQAAQHAERGSPEAADYAGYAERLRRVAQGCRDRADDLTANADTLARLGPPKPVIQSIREAFGVAA